jgi:DNA-3-methyladenine glycosylase II
MLGVATPVSGFYRRLRPDPLIGPLLRRFSGLRVAGFGDVFEALVTAILAQQIRLDVAYRIRRDLCLAYGRRARIDGTTWIGFPAPSRFARSSVAELRKFGLSQSKARAIHGLAEAFASKTLSHDALEALPDEAVIETLCAFHGVGRWTAEIALLRGLARMDAFPGADLAVVKYLAVELMGRRGKASEARMRALVEPWRPYRGLALGHALEELSRRSTDGESD